MQIQAYRCRRPQIPLTSLVDVVFILLFFFMLASRFAQLQAIELNLAAADGGILAPAEVTRLLRLDADGALRLDGEAVDLEQLLARLREQPGVHLVVQPAPGVPLQQMVELMDRLRPTGARLAAGLAASP